MSADIAPAWCDLQTAVDQGLELARARGRAVSVQWGAVTFSLRPIDTAETAWAAYLAAARQIIRLNDAAQGRSFSRSATT